MQIVEVIPQKRHLTKLMLSGGREVLLDKSFVAERCIRAEQSVTEEQITEWIAESDYARARSRALWFLDRADHSEKALYEKLIRADISPAACARAIARLKELGLLDDVRYAERMAERLMESNVSRREAYSKMLLKGLPRDIVNAALDGVEVDESAQLLSLIEKKYKLKLQSPENTPKVYAALVRKGFSYGAVRDALKKYSEDLENYDV
ncbi:MAG: regulatory protein RecX [Clostridia bacterium]|nr:regulatory protein RecX [Clostridia bacterium]